MIEVSGRIKMSVNYSVKLNISEKEFNNLSEFKKNEIIYNEIDSYQTTSNLEVDEIEILDLEVKK